MGAASSVTAGTPAQSAALLLQGDYHGAVAGYTRALADGPDAGLLANRSRAFLGAGCPGPALLDAEAAVEAKPQSAEAHFRVAEAYAAMGYPCDALDAARRAAALDGSHSGAVDLCASLQGSSLALSARAFSPLLSWGENDVGELGRGAIRGSGLPRPVAGLAGREITDVACGLAHTVAVTACGETWAWGSNAHGQCGLPPGREAVAQPSLVPALIGAPMRAVACGAAHTAAVGRSSGLWTWGLGRQGQLGNGTFDAAGPTPVSALSGRALTGVACGLAHTLAVDGEGSLLAWGANGYGQLGTGHACDHVASPCDAGAGMDGPVAHAACGAAHSVVVTAAGSVFATGSNSCGQLGVGDSTDRQSWTLVQILAPAAMAACGEEFTTFVTRDRAVFSCGLGSARGHETEIPAPVQGLPGDDAPALLACGRAQSVLITEGGQAFTWGLIDADPLEGAVATETPKPMPHLGRRRVLRLGCGRRHFAAVQRGPCAAHSRVRCGEPEGVFADSGGDAAPPAVAAGSRLAMVITHCDENGHPLAQGGAAPTVLGVEFGGAGRALPAFPVDDRLDGTYSVRVRLKEAGLWQLHARWGGSALPGSPSQLRVLPGAVHAPSCALAPEPVASRWAAAYAVSGRVGGADACAAGTGREDARGVGGGGGRGGGEKKDEEDDDEGCVTAAVGETVRLALLLRDRFGNAVPFEAKEWKEDEEGAIHGRIAMRSRSSEDEDEDEGEVVSVELEQVGDAVGDCGNVVLRRSTASPPAQWQRLCVPLEATPRAPGLFRARAWVQGRRGGYEAVPGGVSLRVDAGAVSPAATRVLLSAAPRPEERSPPLHPSSCGVAVAAGSAAVLAVHLHDARGNAINGSAALLALRAVSSSPAALSASVHAPDDAAAWPRAAWAVRAPSGSGDKAGQPPASPTDASALYAGASALVRLFGTGAGAGHSVRLFVGGESVGAISCTVRTGPPSGLRSEVVGVLARNGAAPLEQADPCARGSDGVWRALLPSGPRPALAITALLSVRDDWGNALDDAQALRAVRAAVGRVRARESAEEARAAAASWAAGATPAGTGGVDRDERPPPTGPTLRSIGAADGVQVPGVTLPHQGTVAAEVRVSTGCRLSLAVSVDGESLLEGDIEVETRHSGAVVADARAAARMVAAEARRARAKQAEEEEAARARAAEDKVQRVQRARVEAERRREETRRRLEARNAQRRLMAQLRRVESERREEEARRGRKEEEEARAARVAAARQGGRRTGGGFTVVLADARQRPRSAGR